jgi:HPt (histidine-containing phosphotransfer) domain-containing protein
MNLRFLSRDLGLDEAECTELIKLFVETSRADLAKLKACLASGDTRLACSAAHSLKGAALNMGLAEISEISETISRLIQNGAEETVASHVETLDDLITALAQSFPPRPGREGGRA